MVPLLLVVALGCAPDAPADASPEAASPEAAAAAGAPVAPDAVDRPNFVVIDIDSMRADHLPLVRDGVVVTPRLAQLVGESVRFTNAYSQSGWTLPAILSMLSGRSPHGVSDGPEGRVYFELPGRSLPEILALYGYTTVGAWGTTLPNNDPAILGTFAHKLVATPEMTDPLTDPVVDWLTEAPAQPFFLMVHALDLNSVPESIPDTALHRWSDAEPHAAIPQLQDLYNALVPTLGSDRAMAHALSHYDGALAAYDAGVGRILDTLDARGLTERTVVILTSEHGQEFGEHGGIGHHGSGYEAVLHVPLLIRDPTVPGGRDEAGGVQTIDFAPTVLARAGIEVDRLMEGTSWLGLARGEVADWPARDVYSYSSREVLSLRTERFKLVYGHACPKKGGPPSGCASLHDLAADPGEQRDVRDANPEVFAALNARLEAWGAARVEDGTASTADPRLTEALKRGGYWGMVYRESDLDGTADKKNKVVAEAGVPADPEPWKKKPPTDFVAPVPLETPEQRRARRWAEENAGK
ncbi:MAG: sulfatase [Pseudomonadota bacterium]|nr:sulfatase [Pseudomonadota bacterium]